MFSKVKETDENYVICTIEDCNANIKRGSKKPYNTTNFHNHLKTFHKEKLIE